MLDLELGGHPDLNIAQELYSGLAFRGQSDLNLKDAPQSFGFLGFEVTPLRSRVLPKPHIIWASPLMTEGPALLAPAFLSHHWGVRPERPQSAPARKACRADLGRATGSGFPAGG